MPRSNGLARRRCHQGSEVHRASPLRPQRQTQQTGHAAGLLWEPETNITLWEFMRLWFREDAAPHLAESTLANYLQVANKWIRPIAGTWSLRAFEKPGPVNQLLSHAQRDGVPRFAPGGAVTAKLDRAGPPTVDRIRKILSSALTWGVEHRGDLISANGCKQVTTRRHRRSGRARVTSPASRPERALNAEAAERIARAMLTRTRGRTWQPHRDVILLRCEFGLGLRPEEMAAARWRSLTRPTARGDWILVVDNALSHGRVTGVKTTERAKRVPPIVWTWLDEWRELAAAHGLPVADENFIVSGAAGAGHLTLNQHKKWGARYFGRPQRRWQRRTRAYRTSRERHPTRLAAVTSLAASSPASRSR